MVMEEVKIRGIKSDNRFFIMGENKLFPDLVWVEIRKKYGITNVELFSKNEIESLG
jgi:hypothetical protein